MVLRRCGHCLPTEALGKSKLGAVFVRSVGQAVGLSEQSGVHFVLGGGCNGFLGQNLLHNLTPHVGQAEVASHMVVGEGGVVESQAVENGGL